MSQWLSGIAMALLWSSAWPAATPQYRFFPVATDLTSPRTKDVEADGLGFIWLATESGLYRYDGIGLADMTPEIDGQRAEVSRIAFDRDGGLWLMTETQFIYRDPVTGKWGEPLDQPPQEPGQGIFDFVVDDSGTLWIASWGVGLVHLDPASGTYTSYESDHPFPDVPPIGQFRCLLIDSAGRVWAGSDFGLHLYDADEDRLRFFRNPDPHAGSEAEPSGAIVPVLDIAESRDGTLLLATEHGPLRFHPGPERFSSPMQDADPLYPGVERFEHFPGWTARFPPGGYAKTFQRTISISEGPGGSVWMGVDGRGLDVFQPAAGTWLNMLARPDDVFGLIDDFVTKIHVDPEGLMWFATRQGVSRLDPRSGRFRAWPFVPDGSFGPNTTVANDLMEDREQNLWVASEAGLESLNPESDEWSLYRQYPIDEKGRSYNWVLGLAEDSLSRFWVSTAGRISLFDRSAHVFVNSVETWPFFFMYDDRQGNLLVSYGYSDGMARFDPEKGIARRFDGTEIGLEEIDTATDIGIATGQSFQAYSALEDSQGRHWVTTSVGLKRWRPETLTLTDVDLGMTEPRGISRVLEAEDGRLWLATAQGLKLFQPDELRLAPPGEVSFPTEPVYEMTQDGGGRLWMAVPEGLLFFEPATGQRRLYRREDGLPGNKIDTHRMIRRKNGEIVVATDRGLVTFDPEEFPRIKHGPAVAISALDVDDHGFAPSTFGPGAPLVLDYHDILLRISFVALDLSHPELNRYRYRLAGLEDNWREAGPDRAFATYTTLPPGQYRFEVAASNSDGVWNEAGFALPIRVLPPPWKTGWAYAIYGLAVVLTFMLLSMLRTRNLRARSRELEQTVTARTQEIEEQKQTIAGQASRLEKLLATKNRLFADISHEFRTPLTLIAGPVEEAVEQVDDRNLVGKLSMARQSVNRLTRLVDQLLDLARLDAGQVVSRNPQPLSAIVTSQIKAFRPLAEARGAELREGEIENRWVACGSDALEKILANLLSNAIKFTPGGGQVIVSVRAVGTHVCLEIADTGIGIPVDMQQSVFERFNRGVIQGEQVSGAGIGLALVRELVEACDGHVELESIQGEGTRVSVYLPEASIPASLLDATLQPGSAVRQEVEVLAQTGRPAADGTSLGEAEHILIIEDNADLRRYLPSVLGDGFAYSASEDGETGLETAFEVIPDLVICDAMLPGVDGFAVCEKIKTDPRTSHVPVLMLTARADDASRLKGYEHHADDYLTKPFSGEELRVRCRNLLEARRIMRQRFSRTLFSENGPIIELGDPDVAFLKKLESQVDQRYRDPDFSASSLASSMAMSLRQLQRKTKAIMDHSPVEYIRNYRLMMARKRIEAGESVTQACFSVGFTSQSYFSRCFKAYFGVLPSDLAAGSADPESDRPA